MARPVAGREATATLLKMASASFVATRRSLTPPEVSRSSGFASQMRRPDAGPFGVIGRVAPIAGAPFGRMKGFAA